MKAAILQAPHEFRIEERPIPSIAPDQVLVKAAVCGICTSEVDMWEGKAKGLEFPRFIGHEVGGTVEEVGGEVTSIARGDRVALYAEGGGYAQYSVINAERAVRLRAETPFELALGEPIACSVNGVRKLDIELNDTICLVGCGFMGLIMLQVLKLRTGGRLIAIDTREDMLELARCLGATDTIDPTKEDAVAAVRELTHGRGADIGIEAAGSQRTLDLVTDLVRMEGQLEVFGFHQGEPRSVRWGFWNWMAFRIVNGHTRTAAKYVEAMTIGIDLLESGKLDMKPLITHRYALEEVNEGFRAAVAKPDGFVKGVVVF